MSLPRGNHASDGRRHSTSMAWESCCWPGAWNESLVDVHGEGITDAKPLPRHVQECNKDLLLHPPAAQLGNFPDASVRQKPISCIKKPVLDGHTSRNLILFCYFSSKHQSKLICSCCFCHHFAFETLETFWDIQIQGLFLFSSIHLYKSQQFIHLQFLSISFNVNNRYL